ncbi:predicted protein [Nematostella vectensis]|uniref:G-protein coupled receptors family 1 profile domain-containing protein n=1 Tax=Nematostella vectensis TaxID=45351 RepID=A7SWP2_NEMVE|nr:predicted protein [Nematostella vectensis]|eukprot:XP_001623969.1 predicted protein [Nematostella vectensis]
MTELRIRRLRIFIGPWGFARLCPPYFGTEPRRGGETEAKKGRENVADFHKTMVSKLILLCLPFCLGLAAQIDLDLSDLQGDSKAADTFYIRDVEHPVLGPSNCQFSEIKKCNKKFKDNFHNIGTVRNQGNHTVYCNGVQSFVTCLTRSNCRGPFIGNYSYVVLQHAMMDKKLNICPHHRYSKLKTRLKGKSFNLLNLSSYIIKIFGSVDWWLTVEAKHKLIDSIMTIERYLAVVFCLQPDIRLFTPIAHGFIAVIFFLSFVFAILPFTVLKGIYVPDSHCTPVSEPTSEVIEYMMIPGGLAFILYFLTFPLYVHMYLYVTKSSQAMGIQREGKVARRIALIVFSNMAFFFLPIVLLLLVNLSDLGELMTDVEKDIFWKTFSYICFAVNACLNPVLFAFRNEKFRNTLRQQLHLTNRVQTISCGSSNTSKATSKHMQP